MNTLSMARKKRELKPNQQLARAILEQYQPKSVEDMQDALKDKQRGWSRITSPNRKETKNQFAQRQYTIGNGQESRKEVRALIDVGTTKASPDSEQSGFYKSYQIRNYSICPKNLHIFGTFLSPNSAILFMNF